MMKRNLTKIAFAAVLCFAALAAQAYPSIEKDTTLILSADTVRLINGNDAYQIEVKGTKGNPHYRYNYTIAQDSNTIASVTEKNWDFKVPFVSDKKKSRKKNNKWEIGVGGISVGFICPTGAPGNMNTDMGRSFEISMPRLLYLEYNRFSLAGGINWKNYRMMGMNYFNKDGNSVTVNTYPDGTDPDFSRLKIFSWTFSCFYEIPVSRNSGIMFGPMLNFNTHGSLLTRYTTAEGEKMKIKNKDIHQAPVTIDLLVDFRVFKSLHIYLKYAPCHVFQSGFGPEFSSFSAGFGIGL